ncbi:hypothetical protein FQR65_LT08681 [Abscondita terminalis]|nr:hypothetical protein FQR65_LT08681 [Abscondita terminalis]
MPFLKDKSKLISNTERLIQSTNKNGFRKSIFTKNHDRYIGTWKNNVKEGHGQCLTRTFKLYEGEWKNNYRHGFGVINWRDEKKIFRLEYRGDWRNGYQHGFGAKYFRDGGYYLGNIKYSKRHGYGQMWYSDGGYYDGYWLKDKRHGVGMWVRPDGNRYEGSWKDDMKHGKGKFFHLDSGQMQEGIWKMDICVFSVLLDIPYRQSALIPTEFPIPEVKLILTENVCNFYDWDEYSDSKCMLCDFEKNKT